ncbi:amino acid ABC transporter permease [Levilactobacillus bambusae]|uniref:Glutamine ABC transporter permease n=1 Tax=Levilactobacillus bambusae TaxID=2024736 RepID=A0A2V1MYJ2_9LACO|nr:amino acid ABC transporter permease [Levilactobacillus bambusae]PWG00039.1 glutamine ABC transporter permease [Levilactobacillus bambusae]
MIHIFQEYGGTLLYGLGQTLLCSLIALFLSLVIGTLFALMEESETKWLREVARVYIEVFRNIPLLVITMFFYVVFPLYIIKMSGFVAGTIGLTLYTSAFIAETVRAGIQSVDPGQMEGARANGMTYWQAMRYVVLPQAFRYVIPPLGNQFVNLVKNSSTLAFVAGFDLMYEGNIIASNSLETMSTYACVALLYLIITMPVSYYMKYLENKLA